MVQFNDRRGQNPNLKDPSEYQHEDDVPGPYFSRRGKPTGNYHTWMEVRQRRWDRQSGTAASPLVVDGRSTWDSQNPERVRAAHKAQHPKSLLT